MQSNTALRPPLPGTGAPARMMSRSPWLERSVGVDRLAHWHRMTSGVVMWLANNRDRPWSTIHTDSVVILGGLVGIHILLYLPLAPRAAIRDLRHLRDRHWTPSLRLSIVSAVLVGGIVLGFATQPAAPFPVR